MNIIDKVERIKTLVRKHGNYRVLADKAGVGYEWLSKFAAGSIENPGVKNVAKLEQFFSQQITAN